MASLSGIVTSIFIFLYVLLYAMRDLYISTRNITVRKYINQVLPFLTKYNSFFIFIALLFAIIHVAYFYNECSILNLGYGLIFLILFILKKAYKKSTNIRYDFSLNFASYLLVLTLIIHFVFKV